MTKSAILSAESKRSAIAKGRVEIGALEKLLTTRRNALTNSEKRILKTSHEIRAKLAYLLYDTLTEDLASKSEQKKYSSGFEPWTIEFPGHGLHDDTYRYTARSYHIVPPPSAQLPDDAIKIISRKGVLDECHIPNQKNAYHRGLEDILRRLEIPYEKREFTKKESEQRVHTSGGWASGSPDPTRFDTVSDIVHEIYPVPVKNSYVEFTIPMAAVKEKLLPKLRGLQPKQPPASAR